MSRITVEHATVEFPVYGSERSFRTYVYKTMVGGVIDRDSKNRVRITALKDISFEISPGSRVGLVGHNGAGKSTLLQALAGIYEPVAGRINVAGTISTLFNPSMGFDDHDTGYRNITTCGLVLGMTHKEIEDKTTDIVEFTELGEYLSLPVKIYSAGMKTRIAFAVATAIDPDILLMDEGIGAGDVRFQAKALDRVNELVERTNILVVASHSEALIRRYCNKAMLLHQGSLVMMGDLDDVFEKHAELQGESADA